MKAPQTGKERYFTTVFTALNGMPARTSYEKAVCPSVCPSVRLSIAWIVTKWKKGLSIFLHHERPFCLVFVNKIICRLSSFIFGQNWPTLQHDLSAIAELLLTLIMRWHSLLFDNEVTEIYNGK